MASNHLILPPPLPFPPLSLFDPNHTISKALAQNPTLAPKKAAKDLFPKPFFVSRLYRRFFIKRDLNKGRDWTTEQLDEASARGSFPQRPSDLFLKIYADVLTTLTRDPLIGNVSSALLGTSGVIPLSIVSTIPDILAHYHDCIVLAEEEIFLTSNYWQPSDSVNTIGRSLRELSKAVGERQGKKIVCKIMWDRGDVKQLVKNHVMVTPKIWTGLDLPAPEEVPNLSLQVINFHRPLLGTFHQKLMVIDRKIALLNSNNMQDRPNVEMMIHLEGPVVDSLYDTLLLSWHEKFTPPLPCVSKPSLYNPDSSYTFSDSNPYLKKIDVLKAAQAARSLLAFQHNARSKQDSDANGEHTKAKMPFWLRRGSGEVEENLPEDGDLNLGKPINDGDETEKSAKRRTHAFANLVGGMVHSKKETEKEKSAIGREGAAEKENANATGDLAHTPLDSNDLKAGHALRNTTSSGSVRLSALSKALNAGAKKKAEATIFDESLIDDFKPHMIHTVHKPFPIALVNRKPHGLPGHQDVRVPQNAAWLAGLRYATRDVFIQTPTLNAKPVVRGIVEACIRGIQVKLYLDLGFNDQGESVPFQGGTNEEVVFYLFKTLSQEAAKNLHVYWYVGKDQCIPLNAVHKTRNCHVKFFSADGHIAILGNGNQDSQSWFHSQESNVLIDSAQVVEDTMDQLRSNQSTEQYGKVDNDGIWRDPKTKEPLQAPKKISCFTAISAMI